MTSFKWHNGEVFMQPGTGRTRAMMNYLKNMAGWYDMDTENRVIYSQVLWILSRVDHVDGDIGVHVPNGDATPDNVRAFCDFVLDAPEALFNGLDDAAMAARAGDNDPALLPPEELDDDEKKGSKKKGASNG